uniref:hypothetical protein n=1 Tax=Alteromonas sp. AO-Serp TaxID=2804349 RepID=UPI0025800707
NIDELHLSIATLNKLSVSFALNNYSDSNKRSTGKYSVYKQQRVSERHEFASCLTFSKNQHSKALQHFMFRGL